MPEFYNCGPDGDASDGPRNGADRHFTIDIHCHVLFPEVGDIVAPSFSPDKEMFLKYSNRATIDVNARQEDTIREQMTSLEVRLAIMDKAGIDIQAISPAPFQYYYWAEPELGRQAARQINDNIAAIVADTPERFVGLGTVPLQQPEFAVAELERMVRDLNLRGVEISTNIEGVDLADARFRRFFAKAEELGILIFMHPSGTTDAGRLADHYFINVIGNPLDSTIAVHHLIFGGVLEEYPGLKICVAHGGGYLPAYSGRIDHAHGAREDCRRCIAEPPTSYLKKLYFDSIVFTTHQLEYLVQQYGADHILLGTDYPYDMGVEDPVGFINSASALSDAERRAIMGRNAAGLLGIDIPESAS